MAQCTAKSKRTGERCRRQAMIGMTVCYMHGGKSRKGIDAPNFRHGRYSRYMPTGLLDAYEAAVHDDQALKLDDERALLTARLTALLAQVKGGEGAQWGEVRREVTALRQGLLSGKTDTVAASLRRLDDLLTQGVNAQAVWGEVYDVVERLRRVVDTAHRHAVDAQQVVTATEFMTFIGRITALALQCFAQHPDSLRRFSDGIVRLIGPAGGELAVDDEGLVVPGSVVNADNILAD